ncbi:hypothetical protein BZG36_01077 [Bifiguratus adelaidae]|uniref:Pyridoxamine 5'-phosphate oxidase Alr4036 family FMN-binding domain-containing protein n=1 Tax=Bifiguratus adelaidae TaxID=1938954 RepID=A0A261Y613_9FUNG|nr:hypothetical protein BZG36_01077 [Bifiguratus adelaidae]
MAASNSLSGSPVEISSPNVPWFLSLQKSFNRRYAYNNDDPVYVQMANIKRNGQASMHSLSFQDFLDDDCRFIEFLLAMNDNILMGDIKANPEAKLCWTIRNEQYYFTGKFYIASAPIQVTRFPPPKMPVSDMPAAEYWEEERLKQWRRLNPQIRAKFTWPTPGDLPKADRIAYTCLSLDDMTSQNRSANASKAGAGNSVKLIHDIALDNFCLLIFKVIDVMHLNLSTFPPRRLVYQYSAKDHTWQVQEANP